jgi:hypothetical protein
MCILLKPRLFNSSQRAPASVQPGSTASPGHTTYVALWLTVVAVVRTQCLRHLQHLQATRSTAHSAAARSDTSHAASCCTYPTVHCRRALIHGHVLLLPCTHIPDFARIAAPLQQLTKKHTRFEWSAECDSAFEKLNVALTSAEVLRLPNWDLPFILTTDFSLTGLGAVLSQIDPTDGLEYAVSYASRALTPAEQRYAPTEGEMLGLVWGIEKYRYYLYGRKFTVHCDHHALQWIQTARFSNSKVERWALKLQEYQFDVIYKKGVDNTVADCLSRSVAVNIARLLCHKPDPAEFQGLETLSAGVGADAVLGYSASPAHLAW